MSSPAPENSYRIAVIRGDGIGPELVDAAFLVLDAVSTRHGFSIEQVPIDAGAGTYERTGSPLSGDDLQAIRVADSTLKGPVGLPDVRLPDGTEAGLLGGELRNGLDLYANVRPILLLPGVRSPLRVEPGSIDYVIVRENTEGLYAARGKGVGNSWAVADTMIVTRPGSARIARFAFELALRRGGAPDDGVRRVTCVDKANVLRSLWFFRQVFLEIADQYPGVEAECLYVDAAAQALVMRPEHFDVIVTENLFGDILSDLGGGTVGGIALCPSGNIGDDCSYFEPIHGSAPVIAGQNKANPVGQILASAMMLDHLGEPDAGEAIRQGVMAALGCGAIKIDPTGAVVGGPDRAARQVVDHMAMVS